jgi:hypothetical protein
MSENDKKGGMGVPAITGLLALLSTVFGMGYQLAQYSFQLKEAQVAAARDLEAAKAEKEEAIAECEKAGTRAVEEQQSRIEALLERIEALAKHSTNPKVVPDIGQLRGQYEQVPNFFRKGGK